LLLTFQQWLNDSNQGRDSMSDAIKKATPGSTIQLPADAFREELVVNKKLLSKPRKPMAMQS
jgi:hypothetical protein